MRSSRMKADETLQPTNAKFTNVLYTNDPSGGIILANDNYGPDHQINSGKAPLFQQDSLMVPLRQWSDIAFLSWKSLTGPRERRHLRFVLRRTIKNDLAVDVLKHIAKRQGLTNGRVPYGNAMAVEPNTDGWLALLASPNVSGVCWLLIQHQADLGQKKIKNIQVVNEYKVGIYAPTMIIEISDRDASGDFQAGVLDSNVSKL